MAEQTITICSTCASLDDELRAEVERMKEAYGGQVAIVEVDCLDACDEYPVMQVETRTITEVTPGMLREAIEQRASRATE